MIIRKAGMIDMQNMLAQFCMGQLGFGPVGEIRMLTGATGNSRNYFQGRINEANLHTNIAKAEAAMVTQRNDVLVVSPDSHSWYGDDYAANALLTWDKQNTHVLGLDPGGIGGYQRARFAGDAATIVSLMTVSGNSNKFKNLRWMHGSGSATETQIMTVSGAGNVFENCCFASPINQTQADSANFRGMIVTGSSNHFKNCLFGTSNAIHRNSASSMLQLSGGNGLNVFENCIFRSRSQATTPVFIRHTATGTGGQISAFFLNCQFVNATTLAGSYDLAVGITNSADATMFLYFDNRCSFSGVTNVVTSGQEAKIYWGNAGGNADFAAYNDRLGLGLAVNPAT